MSPSLRMGHIDNDTAIEMRARALPYRRILARGGRMAG